VQAFLPALRATRGTLIALLSVAARRGFRDWSAYCASKWGLAGFVAALREELAGTGIRILEVFPGAVDTPIWDGIPGEWRRPAMMRADEVARTIVAALDCANSVAVEQLHLNPPGGAL
jgi:NAD(P)-dependent dehydrogenase (short-subunit alcohol dehydrogenase family)